MSKTEYGRRQFFGNVKQIQPGQLLDYVIQRHDALRRGTHRDIRIGNDQVGGMFSWATNAKEFPQEEGERSNLVRTNLHTTKYKDWEGIIPVGKYGAGRVSKQEEGKALINSVGNKHFTFSVAHKKHPERYAMVNPYKDRSWIMIRQRTPTDTGAEKQKYKNIEPEDVEKRLLNLKPGEEAQAKIDGALQFLNLKDGKAEMLSHRISKTTGKPVIQTERFFGKIPHFDLPKELRNSVLLGEVFGEKDGKTISNADLSGILNSSVAKALTTQKDQGINMKALLFDVAKLNGKKPDAPYSDRKELLEKFLLHLPKGKFETPKGETTSEGAQKLYKDIKDGKHSQTYEGIVIHGDKGVPSKAKVMPEADVHITGTFPAEKGSKYEGKAVGGFTYATSPAGASKGRIGTGIPDALRRLAYEQPDLFKGRIARIHSHELLRSGAHRVPVLNKGQFLGIHEDY